MEDVKTTIKAFIQETFMVDDQEQLTNDVPLLSSGIIDSISALELVEFLEKTFHFKFQPHEVDQENLDTIARIEAFVKTKKAA
ncbi:MAG: acyl carrier protein [Bacteroidetes bacterium]|nr:MAG: acyl carrier protein [Bacteroidota bacterium]